MTSRPIPVPHSVHSRQRRGQVQDTWLTIEYEGCLPPFTPERVMPLRAK